MLIGEFFMCKNHTSVVFRKFLTDPKIGTLK